MTRALDVMIHAAVGLVIAALLAAGCCFACKAIDPKDCTLLEWRCLDAVDAGPQ